jgi:hypothetical protein
VALTDLGRTRLAAVLPWVKLISSMKIWIAGRSLEQVLAIARQQLGAAPEMSHASAPKEVE